MSDACCSEIDDVEKARGPERAIRVAFKQGVIDLRGWMHELPMEHSLLAIPEQIPVVDMLGRPLLAAWEPALVASALRSLEDTPEKVERPDPVVIATRIAREQGAALVSNITATTRRAITNVIARAIRENWTIAKTRAALKDMVGLNQRQERALATYRSELGASGMKPAAQAKALERRRKKMVAYRAEMIARTETARAENEARDEVWARLAVEGMLDRRLKRKWIQRDGCPICKELARHRAVDLGEAFVSSTLGPIMRPPGHVNCRCTLALVMR